MPYYYSNKALSPQTYLEKVVNEILHINGTLVCSECRFSGHRYSHSYFSAQHKLCAPNKTSMPFGSLGSKLLSSLKIGTTAEKGRVFKETRTGSACQVCARAAVSHVMGVEKKGSMSENPSLGRNFHPLWLFYRVTIIDACPSVSVNIYRHDIITTDFFAALHTQLMGWRQLHSPHLAVVFQSFKSVL